MYGINTKFRQMHYLLKMFTNFRLHRFIINIIIVQVRYITIESKEVPILDITGIDAEYY